MATDKEILRLEASKIPCLVETEGRQRKMGKLLEEARTFN